MEQKEFNISNIDITNNGISPICYKIKKALIPWGIDINPFIKEAKHIDTILYNGHMHWTNFLQLLESKECINSNISFTINKNKICIYANAEIYKFNIGDIVYMKNIINKLHVGVKRMEVLGFEKNYYNNNLLVILSDIDQKKNKQKYNLNKNTNKIFKYRKDAEKGRVHFDKEGNLNL